MYILAGVLPLVNWWSMIYGPWICTCGRRSLPWLLWSLDLDEMEVESRSSMSNMRRMRGKPPLIFFFSHNANADMLSNWGHVNESQEPQQPMIGWISADNSHYCSCLPDEQHNNQYLYWRISYVIPSSICDSWLHLKMNRQLHISFYNRLFAYIKLNRALHILVRSVNRNPLPK
jgi:hypothetical protein